jgi:hypothetical protein
MNALDTNSYGTLYICNSLRKVKQMKHEFSPKHDEVMILNTFLFLKEGSTYTFVSLFEELYI